MPLERKRAWNVPAWEAVFSMGQVLARAAGWLGPTAPVVVAGFGPDAAVRRRLLHGGAGLAPRGLPPPLPPTRPRTHLVRQNNGLCLSLSEAVLCSLVLLSSAR